MPAAFLEGAFLGLSLILAIGAQNAFVLRQGLRREHVFAVSAACAVSDATLIAAGVAGFGWIVATAPWTIALFTWGGAAFLAVYGALALRSAWRGSGALSAAGSARTALWPTLLTCLALTWLNPHVYLDTVVLLGSVSARMAEARWVFGAGAMTANAIFFFSLGYGARLLAPLFARPAAWRILDLAVAAVMWAIAARLILG